MNSVINSTSSGTVGHSERDRHQEVESKVIADVATKLGKTEAGLLGELSTGKTLHEIAAAKGVAKEDLDATVSASVAKSIPNASPRQVANIANRIAKLHGRHAFHTHTAPSHAPADGPSARPPSGTGVHINIVA